MKRILDSLRIQERCYTRFRYEHLKQNDPIIWDSIADAILLPTHGVATRKLKKLCADHRYYALCVEALHNDIKKTFLTGTAKNALFDIEAKELISRYNRNKELLVPFLEKFPKKRLALNENIYAFVMMVVISIIFFLPLILIIPIFDIQRSTTAIQKVVDFKKMAAVVTNSSIRTIANGIVENANESSVIANNCYSFVHVTRELSTRILASIELESAPIVLISAVFIFVGIVSIMRSSHRIYNSMQNLLQDAMEQDASIIKSREFIANLVATKQTYAGNSYFLYENPRL